MKVSSCCGVVQETTFKFQLLCDHHHHNHILKNATTVNINQHISNRVFELHLAVYSGTHSQNTTQLRSFDDK